MRPGVRWIYLLADQGKGEKDDLHLNLIPLGSVQGITLMPVSWCASLWLGHERDLSSASSHPFIFMKFVEA